MSDMQLVANIVYTKYVISRVLYAYYSDEKFRNNVNKIIEDPLKIRFNGEPIDSIWRLEFGCDDVARQLIAAYEETLNGGDSE